MNADDTSPNPPVSPDTLTGLHAFDDLDPIEMIEVEFEAARTQTAPEPVAAERTAPEGAVPRSVDADGVARTASSTAQDAAPDAGSDTAPYRPVRAKEREATVGQGRQGEHTAPYEPLPLVAARGADEAVPSGGGRRMADSARAGVGRAARRFAALLAAAAARAEPLVRSLGRALSKRGRTQARPAPEQEAADDAKTRVIAVPRDPSSGGRLAMAAGAARRWASRIDPRVGAGLLVLLVLAVLVLPELPASEPAMVQLVTTPRDANVLLDGVVKSRNSPHILSGIDPDRPHVVAVQKMGYSGWHTTLELSPGQIFSLPDVTLSPSTASGAAQTPSSEPPDPSH